MREMSDVRRLVANAQKNKQVKKNNNESFGIFLFLVLYVLFLVF